MGLAGLFIVIVILGALFGGKSFGSTIRTGCGVLVLLVILAIVIAALGLSRGKNRRPNRGHQLPNKHMVAVGRGLLCGTSAACARSLLSRRARAATAAAAHVQRVMPRITHAQLSADRGDTVVRLNSDLGPSGRDL